MPRKLRSQDANPYEVIRGMWEAAYVSHFIRLFQREFGFTCVTTQDLEEALLEKGSVRLADYFARLLRYVSGNTEIVISNFESSLRNLLLAQDAHVPHFLEKGTTWCDLTAEEKLTILKWLIDHVHQEKEENIADFADEHYSAEDLRGVCAGQDALNNVYWYFDDLRLYREFPPRKQRQKEWECVCKTLPEWHTFIKQFRKTSNAYEKELYSYLNFELLPFIEVALQNNKNVSSQEEVDKFILNKENEDLNVMLVKDKALKNSGVCVKQEETSTQVESHNGIDPTEISNSVENQISKLFTERDETCGTPGVNHNDGNLSSAGSDKQFDKTDSLLSAMDLKNNSESSVCANSCSTQNASDSDGCIITDSTVVNSCAIVQSCIKQDSITNSVTVLPISSISNDVSHEEIPPMSAISNMVGSTTPATTASVQPLPSNMVNKSTFQIESQYMQQQSQIFVFSTSLANKAADAYLSGQYPSIIAYHCAQPGTKAFLEKHPLKVHQFNRQNPAQWLNNLAQMKQSGKPMNKAYGPYNSPPNMNNRFQGPPGMNQCNSALCCASHGAPVAWGQNTGPPMQNEPWSSSNRKRFPCPGMLGNPSHPCPVNGGQFANQHCGGFTPLTGIKVPDENLTPQQRQHREEQLAMIRKMQQLLFPEHQQIEGTEGVMGPNIGEIVNSSLPPQGPYVQNDRCAYPQGIDSCFNSNAPCVGDQNTSHPPDMFMGSAVINPNFSQQNFPPSSVSAQVEWQKLQNQFYEERCKKQPFGSGSLPVSPNEGALIQNPAMQQISQIQTPVQSPQQNVSQALPSQVQTLNSPSPKMSPSNRVQSLPPPYHTSRKPMSSPIATSPSTSSISLPSPNMTHSLNSPAESRQFSHSGSRMPHPSPGSVTPVGSGSLHTTPLNSPKPLNTSGACSNTSKEPSVPINSISTPSGTPTSSSAPLIQNSAPSTPCSSISKQSSSMHEPNSADQSNQEFPSPCQISTTSTNQADVICPNLNSCKLPSQKPDACTGQGGLCMKEPSLMPVPSPQQIQYLNTFDGQELTIQKQPNTSIKELDIIPTASIASSMIMASGTHTQFQRPDHSPFSHTPVSCPSMLENSQDSMTGRFPMSAPPSVECNIQCFTSQSPQITGLECGPRTFPSNENMIPRFPNSSTDVMRLSAPHHHNQHHPFVNNNNRFPRMRSQVSCESSNCGSHMSRFPASETMQKFRGLNPHSSVDIMHSRMSNPGLHISCMNNVPQSAHFNDTESDLHGSTRSLTNPIRNMPPCNSSFPINNAITDNNAVHSHLQNLQKMTPPFEPSSKNSSNVMSPLDQCSSSSVTEPNLSISTFDEPSPVSTSSQLCSTQKLPNFDPIASMSVINQSNGHPSSSVDSVQGHSNESISDSTTNTHISENFRNSHSTTGNNLSRHFQPAESGLENPVSSSRETQHTPFGTPPVMPCGLQTVNNSFGNAMNPTQQITTQNIVPSATYNGSVVNSNTIHSPCQVSGANTISCSVTTNHPIMHTAVTSQNSNITPHSGTQNFSQPSRPGCPSVIGRGSPYNSPTIPAHSNAPNSIQYLPARQQNLNRPSTLEFLQRYAPPLTNLDSKVPTHNLQYFPTSGNSNMLNINPNSGPMNPGMMNNSHRPVSMMIAPIMRGSSPNINHPSGQIFPVGSDLPAGEPSMFNRPSCPSNSMMTMSAMRGCQNMGMFSNKPMPMVGMAPEATQPLPPSMSQSFNYKQSPFYGPTTADPNYAVQFHNFQQQLYATNTRSSQMNAQNTISGQGFFGPK